MKLRLLIDEAVNGFVARALAEVHDTVSAVELGLSGSPDPAVAAELDRLVITEDRNFARSVIGHYKQFPGVVVLELRGLTTDERIARPIDALSEVSEAVAQHLTIIRRDKTRQRPL